MKLQLTMQYDFIYIGKLKSLCHMLYEQGIFKAIELSLFDCSLVVQLFMLAGHGFTLSHQNVQSSCSVLPSSLPLIQLCTKNHDTS